MRDVTSIKTRRMDGDFVREQSTICFALARKAASPERRAYFLRLAWHWRGIQRALAGRDMPRGVVVAMGEGSLNGTRSDPVHLAR